MTPDLFTYTIRTDRDPVLDEWEAVCWRVGPGGSIATHGEGHDNAPLVGRGHGLSKTDAIAAAVESFDTAADAAGVFSDE